jgi:hypothetical protein
MIALFLLAARELYGFETGKDTHPTSFSKIPDLSFSDSGASDLSGSGAADLRPLVSQYVFRLG